MITFKVDLKQFDEAVKNTRSRLDRICVKSVMEASKKGAEYARTHHKHKYQTGNLTSRKNLFGRFKGFSSDTATAEIVNIAPYAAYIEYGTKPHTIRGNPLLTFFWERVGHFVAFRSVRHPGNKAMPFMEPASKYAEKVAMTVAIEEIRKMAREVWGS